MKLQIRTTEGPSGAVLVICDPNGEVIGGQTKSELQCNAFEQTEFTVTFIVDGEDVVLAKSEAAQ